MAEPDILPPIFRELIEAADSIDRLSPPVWEVYFAAIGEDETLIPEIVSVLGPSNFETLVRYFGGQTVRIPKPDEVYGRTKDD